MGGLRFFLGRVRVTAVMMFVVAAVVVPAAPAHAAAITVNTLEDELNSDGDCSLREAIEAANTNAAVDACPAGDPAPSVDVIVFSVMGTITLTSGQLTVTDELTIDGPGPANLAISGNNGSRVLEVSVGVTLNLGGVTIADGREYQGGGHYGGGGINNTGTLTVTSSNFSGNSAPDGYGGGILNESGTVTITESTFSGNSASIGSGISNFFNGSLTVTNSTFSGNSASVGGGIHNNGGLTVTNSTFSGNSATQGGGIWSSYGTVIVTNTTLSGNSASQEGGGGGINNPEYAGTTTLQNTIVANSTSGGNCAASPAIIDGGGNLSWPDTTCPGINADPLLGPLQNNGGPTETMALGLGSPAIDAAVLANCPATDQRGVARPRGAGCDIGSFELEQIGAVPVVTGLDNPAAFTFAPDGRIFYGERLTGEVRVFDPDDGSDRLLGRITNLVTSGERGLLGIALIPSINPLPLVFATRLVNGTPTNQILRVSAVPSVIFSSNTPSQSIHNGGRILFGPDARLYAVIGDAANPGNSQDLSRHAGKILRMTANGAVPPDNPFGNHVWAFGIRNSFGFTFDPLTGRLWEEDNGPECNDEINLIPKAGNMAWGPNETCSSPPPPPENTNQDGPNPILPLAWFTPPTAPTGMAFCVGCGLPDSEGTLFFGNFNTRQIVRVVLNASRDGIVSVTSVYTHPRSILSVERGPDKAIYLSDSQGIYKLVET